MCLRLPRIRTQGTVKVRSPGLKINMKVPPQTTSTMCLVLKSDAPDAINVAPGISLPPINIGELWVLVGAGRRVCVCSSRPGMERVARVSRSLTTARDDSPHASCCGCWCNSRAGPIHVGGNGVSINPPANQPNNGK